MEINIFSSLNYKIIKNSPKIIKINKTIINQSDKKTFFETDEIKKIDKNLDTLNENDFSFHEIIYLNYVHYVDLDTLLKCSTDCYHIEKKTNPYLRIEKFKERYFGMLKHYINTILSKNSNRLQWYDDDCYYFLERKTEGLVYQHIYIFDDMFKDENFIYDYMESLLQFIEIFNPEEEYAIQKNQESEEKTENKFTVPQKIKILDKLNIKGWLQGKGYTNYQIEILLSNLFDRTDKTIRDGFSNNKHEKSANEYLEELKNLKANRN